MNKKWIALAAVLLVLIMALPLALIPGESDQPPAQEKEVIRISWWSSPQRDAALTAAIALYCRQNPHITIETSYVPESGYYNKLQTQLAGNAAPDIVLAAPQWRSTLINSGAFHDLSAYETMPDTPLDLSGIERRLLRNLGDTEGNLVGVPVWLDCTYLMANRNISEKLLDMTIEYPSTWEDFLAGVQMFASPGWEDNYYLCADLDMLVDGIFIPYLNQRHGGSWVSDDYRVQFRQEDVADALAIIDALYRKEFAGAAYPIELAGRYNGKIFESPAWKAGSALFSIGRLTDLDSFQAGDFELDVSPLPSTTGRPQIEITGVLACINRQTDQYSQCLDFLNWLINDPGAIEALGYSSGYPANQRAVAHLHEAGMTDNKLRQIIGTALESAYFTPVLQGNQELRAICEDAVARVAYQRAEVQTVAEEFYVDIYNKTEELFFNTRV